MDASDTLTRKPEESMLINKARIIASLTAAIESRGPANFFVNCARWDTILNLNYGSTKMHIKAAANAAGYDTIQGTYAVELIHRSVL